MIITKSDFHSNPFSGFGHTASQKSSLLGVILLRPELRPFIIMIPLSRPFVMHSIIHMFNTSVKPYTPLDQHFNPQFIHYTKCAKYAFLLLFSIYTEQQKKRILFDFHLILETEIKIYPELYDYVWLVSCIRSGSFYSSLPS